jgi:cytochrome c biogenesis protein CcmG/thiol:disulfide interchange protein DsbE
MTEITQSKIPHAEVSDTKSPRRMSPVVLVLVVGLALLLVFALGMKLLKDSLTQLETGPAPSFSINPYGNPSQTFNLTEQRGKVVVVNFWASWCGPCRSEASDLNALWSEYKDRGVVFVGVGYLDNEGDARDFVKEFDIPYLTGPDSGSAISRAYRVKGVPETYIVDQRGNIAVTIPGPTTAKDLRRILDRLLAS